MNFDTHPLLVVERLRESYGNRATCTFSIYEYHPQSIVDERHTFDVPISQITSPWLDATLAALPTKKRSIFRWSILRLEVAPNSRN